VTVVFGKSVKLSGLLSQGGAGLASQSVTLNAEPFGTSTFTQLSTVTTSGTGTYATPTKPKKQTVYQATATGVTAPPVVTVKVAQRLKLSVRRSGGKVYFKGTLGPKKKRRVVVIQMRSGKRWKTLAWVKTSKRSTFKAVRSLKPGHYSFRAKTKAYPGLLGGTSRTVRSR
jgi:hypothetical protein